MERGNDDHSVKLSRLDKSRAIPRPIISPKLISDLGSTCVSENIKAAWVGPHVEF